MCGREAAAAAAHALAGALDAVVGEALIVALVLLRVLLGDAAEQAAKQAGGGGGKGVVKPMAINNNDESAKDFLPLLKTRPRRADKHIASGARAARARAPARRRSCAALLLCADIEVIAKEEGSRDFFSKAAHT